MRLSTKSVILGSAVIALAAMPLTAQAAEQTAPAPADCVIVPHPDWRPAEVHVYCATTGPYKAIALCSDEFFKDKWFESPWTNAGSWAQVACPLTWRLTGWGKQGGGDT